MVKPFVGKIVHFYYPTGYADQNLSKVPAAAIVVAVRETFNAIGVGHVGNPSAVGLHVLHSLSASSEYFEAEFSEEPKPGHWRNIPITLERPQW